MKRLCFSLAFAAFFVSSAWAHDVRYSLHIVEENGERALENIPCETIFMTHTGNWNDMSRGRLQKGLTNASGDFTFEGQSDVNRVTFSIQDEGDPFYPVHRRRIYFGSVSGSFCKRWEPYDSVVTVRLQRVEHPIPLFVKNVSPVVSDGSFDGTNAVLRYDLVLGDWLPPEGKGRCADLVVRTKMTIDEVLNAGKDFSKVFFCFTNEIEFPGKGNGCRSELTPPTAGIRLRSAPDDGYANKIVMRQGTRKTMVGPNAYAKKFTDSDPDRCYSFRIRSQFDDNGKLVKAHYGKVYGDFNFNGHWHYGFQGMGFLYYLNPTPLDRNLEWDMKTNLCPGQEHGFEKRP